MRSWQIIKFGEPLEAREAPDPEPSGREVLLRVTSCGVCHSDLHLWDGYFDMGGGNKLDLAGRMPLPFTMGHEALGEVIAVGPDAEGAQVGDKRVVYPWIGCGECKVCQAGDNLLCTSPQTVGTRYSGGYSDRLVVPEGKYLVPYDGVSEELACTYACSGITAYSALKKMPTQAGDDFVMIVGSGGVGLNGVAMHHAMSDAKLIVADVDDSKLALAKEAGADFVVNNGEPGAVEKVTEISGGGVAGAVDFVGAPASAGFGMQCLARGGKLVVVGLYGGAIPLPLVSLPLQMLTVQGSYVGTLEDLKELMALAQAGKLNPLPVTPTPIDNVNQVLTDLKAGQVDGRMVLKP